MAAGPAAHRGNIVGERAMTASPLVAVRSVLKTYGRGLNTVEALHEVSFEVRQGEFAHLIGPSGSGKSTLINLIGALDRPDHGEIIVAGADVTKLSARNAARYRNERIGIVFQLYNLLPQLTALENVLTPMIPRGRFDPSHALELLKSVGLTDRAEHRPSQLSGGEQQRVAIARALANDPALILADEPTGNLDDESTQSVMDLLYCSCQDRGKTLILVTHDHHSRHPADIIFALRKGILMRMPDNRERESELAPSDYQPRGLRA
jgi:putative ABC transport system ATP-binding protein